MSVPGLRHLSHTQQVGAGVGQERGAHEFVHVAGEVGKVHVGYARRITGDLVEDLAGEQTQGSAFERSVIDVAVAAWWDVGQQSDTHRGRQVEIAAEVARDNRPLDAGAARAERIDQRAYAGEDRGLGANRSEERRVGEEW